MLTPEQQFEDMNNLFKNCENYFRNYNMGINDLLHNSELNLYDFCISNPDNIIFNIDFFRITKEKIKNLVYEYNNESISNNSNMFVNILCYYDYNCLMDGDLAKHVLYYTDQEQYKTSKDTIYLFEKLSEYNYLVCCESFKVLTLDEGPIYLSSRVITMDDCKIKNMTAGSEKEIASYYYPLPEKYNNIKNILSNPYDYFKKEFDKYMSQRVINKE